MIYEDLVSDLEKSRFSTLVKSGVTHKQFQQAIIESFNPFFENKENLQRYANDFLIHTFINYCKIGYENIHNCILSTIKLFRDAKTINENEINNLFAEFQCICEEMGNKHWSMCILEKDYSTLGKYEYVSECFTTIENLSEILLKNYLMLLVYINRVLKYKSPSWEIVSKIKYGNLVNELEQAHIIDDVFGILKSEISISQWRNIACHKNYKLINGTIKCQYGNQLQNEIILNSKEELLDIVKSINWIVETFNLSFKFFWHDNIEDILPLHNKLTDISPLRDETWHLLFIPDAYLNGFKVLNIAKDTNYIRIDLQDITQDDPKIRAVESSLAIFKIWNYTLSDKIEVVYFDSTGVPLLSSIATSEICEEFSKTEDFDYFTEKTIYNWSN